MKRATDDEVSVRVTRRRFILAAGATGIVVACAAPTATAPAPGTSQPSQTLTPRKGGTLQVVGETDVPPGFDPHSTDVAAGGAESTFSQMYEGLVEQEPSGTLAPALAESWSVSADGKTYTFKIRRGVKFHNGRELTSDDVLFSFRRMKDPSTKHPFASNFDIVSDIQAPDPSTAVFTLQKSFAPFLQRLNDVGASIVPKEEVAKGTLRAKPVGTGPFKYVSSAATDFLQVEANRDYWRQGLPYLDGIRLKATPDKQAAVLTVKAGQADVFRDAPAEVLDSLKTGYNIHVAVADFSFSWFQMNPAKVAAFKDVRVRQAINWALDRKEIADLTWPSLSVPLNGGFLPASHPAALKEDVYPKQDIAKAKQLLAEAGYPNGFEFTVNARSDAGGGQYPRLAQVLQRQLAQVGIKVNIAIDPPGVKQMLVFGPANDSMVQGTPATPEPDDTMYVHWMPGGARNIAKFADPQVTEIVLRAQSTSDQAARAKLYQDAQKLVAQIGPTIPIFLYAKYDFSQRYVQGLIRNSTGQNWRESRNVWINK